ncbi:DUF6286 domain-containing protein [Jatrophihabitans sp. YIM 134969]
MTDVRMPRGRRGSAATLTALVGLVVFAAGAVFALVAAIRHQAWLVDADTISDWARRTSLGDTVALVVGIVVGAVGLLLLLAALVPPRRRLVELADSGTGIAAGLTRSSLARTLAAAARGVDGISSAGVSGRRALTVRATTSLRRTDGLADRVQQVVEDRLGQLEPARPHQVRVKLSRKER